MNVDWWEVTVLQCAMRQVELLQDEATSTKGMVHMQTIELFYILSEVISHRLVNSHFSPKPKTSLQGKIPRVCDQMA